MYVRTQTALLSLSVRSYGPNKTIHNLYGSLWGPAKHKFKMASLAVTWMPSLNLWRTKSYKSTTQFYQGRITTAARLVEFVYSLYMSRDMSAKNGWHN